MRVFTAALIVSLVVPLSTLSAQQPPPNELDVLEQAAERTSVLFNAWTFETTIHPSLFQRPGEKSAPLAGFLSFVLPVVGSLYAHNTGHGIRHLAAIPIVVGATIVGLHFANKDGGEAEAAEYGVLLGGGLLLLANGIWGVVTAVNDAHNYNRALDLGPLQVKPAVTMLVHGNARFGLSAAISF
jgi:hypothetical protein